MVSYSIYIVDDEEALARGLAMTLANKYITEAFFSAGKVLNAIKKNPPDLVLLDIRLPDINGIEALRLIKRDFSDTLVIMMTAYEDIKTVISSMKSGAYDFIVKPVQIDVLEVTIRNALETIRLRKEVKLLQERCLLENVPLFIGESKIIQEVMQFVERVAASPDTPVLIYGESGTGKELIAHSIHYRSPNFEGPMVVVNCAAIARTLIESELFGYEKGAFSGADQSGKKGLIEEAEKGTLFLDEVGDLSLEAQSKLLRFLETGKFYRVGGTNKIHIKTRIVSATNKDLVRMTKQGLFRKDLYYRLSVIQVKIPSLNARRDDILPIAQHYLVKFNQKFGKNCVAISAEAERALKQFNWGGDVRELKNVIERAVLLSTGPELNIGDIGIEEGGTPDRVNNRYNGELGFIPPEGVDIIARMESIERQFIEEALRISGGNETQAAQLINLKYSTFRYRMKKLKIK